MKTKIQTVKTFSELTKDEAEKYFENNLSEFEPHDEWYDSTIESFTNALELVGFWGVKIGFSGFWSQGDGAHFTGKYTYTKGALKKVKKEFPEWSELHNFAQELQELQRKQFYSMCMEISHSGHYQHEKCTSFDFEDNRNQYGYCSSDFDENEWKECCRSFMQHIYSELEKEYNYLNSFAYVWENKECFDHVEIIVDEVEETI